MKEDASGKWSIEENGQRTPLTWKDCAMTCHAAAACIRKTILEDEEMRSDVKRMVYERHVKVLDEMESRFTQAFQTALQAQEALNRAGTHIPMDGRRIQ